MGTEKHATKMAIHSQDASRHVALSIALDSVTGLNGHENGHLSSALASDSYCTA